MAFGALVKVYFLKNISLSSDIYGYFIRVFIIDLYFSVNQHSSLGFLFFIFIYLFMYLFVSPCVRENPEIETKLHKVYIVNTRKYRCLPFKSISTYI